MIFSSIKYLTSSKYYVLTIGYFVHRLLYTQQLFLFFRRHLFFAVEGFSQLAKFLSHFSNLLQFTIMLFLRKKINRENRDKNCPPKNKNNNIYTVPDKLKNICIKIKFNMRIKLIVHFKYGVKNVLPIKINIIQTKNKLP